MYGETVKIDEDTFTYSKEKCFTSWSILKDSSGATEFDSIPRL